MQRLNQLAFVATVLSFVVLSVSVVEAGGWGNDVRKAFKVAAHRKQALAIYVTNPGCHKCQMMMKRTLQNPYVKNQMKRMVKAQVDFRKHPEVAEMLKIGELPAVVVLDHKGKELGRIAGLKKLNEFRDKMAKIEKKSRRR